MNNEIKEILAYFEKYVKISDMHYSEPMLNWKDLKIVLDYITNLQHTEDLYNQLLKNYDELEQAYQELKDSKQWWNNRFNAVQRDYEDYKSRIEKTVEMMLKRFMEEITEQNGKGEKSNG